MTPEAAKRDHWQMLKFMGINAIAGVIIGCAAAALIIAFNIGGIGTLIAHARNPILPILLIAFPMALLFGGAVTASAIWLMPYESKFAPRREKDQDD
ncbi:hypothetical protein JJB09_11725 [Rhizobium sp. KVB221]|uniref:Uncharacterized protein n=2 Tax=Rhizobium setariae TaxID=2801340 RepID=A0A937CP27_9HYPH|nr:hypothetical protein [Rhizobium setariae]